MTKPFLFTKQMKVETGAIILLLLIIFGIILYFLFKNLSYLLNSRIESVQEHFENQSSSMKRPVLDDPFQFYDSYYIDRIDQSYFPENKNVCRCSKLYTSAFFRKSDKQKVLLIGTNTGRFLDALCGVTKDVTGIVNHPLLVEKSKHIAPKANVLLGDAHTKPDLFVEGTFTHIIFEDREFYKLPPQDRKTAIANCHKWLSPGGKFIVRAVDPEVFDPMVPSAIPLSGVNIQNYLQKRKTDSVVHFSDGSKIVTHYTPIPSEHRAIFREDLYENTNVLKRTHIHRWSMPPRDVIMEEIMGIGFAHEDTISLQKCTFPGEYYEIFQKAEYHKHMR